MADPQLIARFAWVLEVQGPATIRIASTDLPQAAAVTTLGAFYKKALKGIDIKLSESLPNLFYGVRHRNSFDVVISNADGDMDTTAEWRGSPFTLWHYDIEYDVRRQERAGIVIGADFANGQCVMSFGIDESLLQNLLPAGTIDPKTSSPFERAGSPGAPLPVIFGDDVLVQPPNIHSHGQQDEDVTLDGLLSAYDACVGYGSDLVVKAAWGELDKDRAGLEKLGSWSTAPGSPAYLSTELDSNWRATNFGVTDNQSARYEAGQHIRFKTTVSGSNYAYSVVKAYHAGIGTPPGPATVEIHDALIDSGLNSVQLAGDYQVIRDVYTTVTDGILPVPATAQAFTIVRLFGFEESAPLVLAGNPSYPSGSGGTLPSTIISDVITNPVWGMSARVQQLRHPGTFSAAGIALSLAGLGGSVQGALGYDGKQVPAEQVLDWLCMIARGGRLGMSARNEWTLAVDTLTSSVQTFTFGPGADSGARIKKVIRYGRASLNEAVRNLILHWSPLGRVKAASTKYLPQAYARFSIKAVSGLGQDRHIYNPFIRSETVASLVLQYMAEMLVGADEQLVFTAGIEARDRSAGDVITAVSTVDGFSGDWKITDVTKTLSDVQLTCIRHNPTAYDSPSGITHSSEALESSDVRILTGPGPNLLLNPEPAAPLQLSEGVYFRSTSGSPVYAYTAVPPRLVPHDWAITNDPDDYGVLTEFTVNASEAIRARTKSGNYIRMVWTRVNETLPEFNIEVRSGFVSGDFSVRQATDHIISFYCSADDGVYLVVNEDNDPTFTMSLPTLIRDEADTDGNGWTRYYARWRPLNATTRAIIAINAQKPGTYNISSIQVEPLIGSSRPSEWRRHAVTPTTLTRAQLVDIDGSTTYSLPLIKAGDYAIGATLRVTGTLTSDAGSFKFKLGTEADDEVWARDITDPVAITTSSNYKSGTVAAFFAEDQDILLTFEPIASAQKVQSLGTAQSKSAGTTVAVTVPAAGVGAGHSILLALAMDATAGTVSATDTAGNTYTVDADKTSASHVRTVILSAHNVTALASGNTITITHPSVTARAMSAVEFSALATSSTADKSATASGTSTAPSTGATATTSQRDEVVFGVVGFEGPSTDTLTAGAGYTALDALGTTGGAADTNITVAPMFRIVTATGAQTASGTLSTSRDWAAAVVTYRAANGSSPTSGQFRVTYEYTRSAPTPGT